MLASNYFIIGILHFAATFRKLREINLINGCFLWIYVNFNLLYLFILIKSTLFCLYVGYLKPEYL